MKNLRPQNNKKKNQNRELGNEIKNPEEKKKKKKTMPAFHRIHRVIIH